MKFFEILHQKISNWLTQQSSQLSISGISDSQWGFIFEQLLNKNDSELKKYNNVLIAATAEEAEEVYEDLRNRQNCLFYPGNENSPYNSIINSSHSTNQRFFALAQLVNQEKPFLLVTSIDAMFLKIPQKDFFKENQKKIKIADIISPKELSQNLINLGYEKHPMADEPGRFSQKGEIFDIYPISRGPIRIHFFDELIEEIYEIEKITQKTLRDKPVDEVLLGICPNSLRDSSFVNNLRQNIPMPQPQYKNKYQRRKEIFELIQNQELFENYTSYLPLFFDKTTTIFDYLSDKTLFYFFNKEKCISQFHDFIETCVATYNEIENDIESYNILPSIESFYETDIELYFSKIREINITNIDHNISLESNSMSNIPLNLIDLKSLFLQENISQQQAGKNIFSYIRSKLERNGHLLISARSKKSKEEINYLLDNNHLKSLLGERISFIEGSIDKGFYYPNENLFVLSDGDLFSSKKKKVRSVNTNPDLFAEQIATLKVNDYVIHKDHGIGIYKGLQGLEVAGKKSDFIVIHYQDDDKIFLPVYKINLIQKHADSEAIIKIASLKSKKFENEKLKARKSIKKLAFDLLKLQAERKSQKAYSFSAPDHLYNEFELSFPFTETPDQEKAISDVLMDMQNESPMERLICGDVGFGKTEVAMRASFKAVLDKKQVCILVPTTVLALQHYQSFKKRFEKFPVNIDFLSRFKSKIEANKTLSELSEGKIDIIIGTHKLLSKEVGFSDLGLVIIDEEHRFGVGHKEKLKLLKQTVDCLIMTATPIPRTLQLSFLGIRDLSLIQTPPPKRQSIKTFVIRDDKKTLKDAIEKELKRGGQVFFVHNRVQDIEKYSFLINELVPESKIVVAHGQLPEKELEKRIKSFYLGEKNILISTTIIESGIDIPTANTMIINRADNFGLAQLHQLRGRIGRSDKKAYAYLVIPQNKKISSIAEKRLRALQTCADIGSGFAIASTDLEIRGSGDILGGEQSGHISTIGLELYMELLNEALAELKGQENSASSDIEIQTNLSAFIPDSYISDPAQRLKYYKKIANSRSNEVLDTIKGDLIDIYGIIPDELNNLFYLLKIRNILQFTGLKSVKLASKSIHLAFDQKTLEEKPELRNKVLDFFLARPKVYKLHPNYSIDCFFNEQISKDKFFEFSNLIAQQISSPE